VSPHRPSGPIDCAEASDLVPDLALGLLDGAERATVLAHVEGCVRCQADLAGLTEVGENVLLLAPAAEPPPGFESRVLAQVGPPRSPRARWSPGRPLLAAAAVLAVLLVAGAVLALTGGGDDGRDGGERAAPATSTTGPGGVLATVDMLDGDGEVVAVAEYRQGRAGQPAAMTLDMAEWVADLQDRGVPSDAEWWLVVHDTAGEAHSYPLAVTPTAEIPLVHGPAVADAVSVAITGSNGRTLCQGTFPHAT
jgi:putative zinc finger protein